MLHLPKCAQENLRATTQRPTDDEAQTALAELAEAIFCTPKTLLNPVVDENKPEEKKTQNEKEFAASVASQGQTVMYHITKERFIQLVPYGVAAKLLRLALEYVLKGDRNNKLVEVLMNKETSPVGALPAGIAHAAAKHLCAIAASLDQNSALCQAMSSAFQPAIKNPRYKPAPAPNPDAPDTRTDGQKNELLREAGPGFLSPELAALPVTYTIMFTATLLGSVLLNLDVVRVSGITDNQLVYHAAIEHFHSAYRLAFPFHCLLCKAVPFSKELANRMAASTAKAGNFGVDVVPTVVLDYARQMNFIEVMSKRTFDRAPDPQDLLNHIPADIMMDATRTFTSVASEPAGDSTKTTPPTKKGAGNLTTTATDKKSGTRRDRDRDQEQAGNPSPSDRKKNKAGVFLTEEHRQAYNNFCTTDKLSDTERTLLWKHAKLEKVFPKLNPEKILKVEKLRELTGKLKKGDLK